MMVTRHQAMFLFIRGIALLGLLTWMLVSLTSSSNVGLLLLLAGVVLFWFCFSILMDLIWPAGDGSGTMRHSVFGMIDVYMAVSFLVILQGNVLVAGLVVALYCLVVTIFQGFLVGLVSAMAGGLGMFNSRGFDAVAGLIPLILTFAGGLAGAGSGLIVMRAREKIAERIESRSSAQVAAEIQTSEPPPAVESREDLLEKIRIMQENFDKVCKERDELQEQVAELEDKMTKEL